jgi:hypothetical protein
MTDTALETALFAAAGTKQGHRRHAEPDWAEIHRELKRKHVTLTILWDEYIERCPEEYRYSRFCELYRSWASRLSVTMRQAHIGGDKLFVDYAGDTVPVIVDRAHRPGPCGADFRRRDGRLRPPAEFRRARDRRVLTQRHDLWHGDRHRRGAEKRVWPGFDDIGAFSPDCRYCVLGGDDAERVG